MKITKIVSIWGCVFVSALLAQTTYWEPYLFLKNVEVGQPISVYYTGATVLRVNNTAYSLALTAEPFYRNRNFVNVMSISKNSGEDWYQWESRVRVLRRAANMFSAFVESRHDNVGVGRVACKGNTYYVDLRDDNVTQNNVRILCRAADDELRSPEPSLATTEF